MHTPPQKGNMQNTCDKRRHFVLVHGLGHGAWSWFKLKPLLESAGHRVSTFNLSASGTDTKVIQHVPTFYDYSTPLLDFMASIPPEEKVILVGHSLGGMNISLAMENFPKKISVAIFLTAFMPDTVHKPSYVIEQLVERAPQDTWLDTQFLPYKDEESEVAMFFGPKFVSSKLYQLCSDEDRELGKILIRPGSLFLKDLPNAKQFTGKGYGSVRRVFVLSDEDETIKEDFQRWMIDNSPVDEVIELKGVDHMPMAQASATVFVAKFFGRAGLLSFLSSVPEHQRPALFQSLLFEACGRTVNPINGAVGLLWTGNWHVCQSAVATILRGGSIQAMPELFSVEATDQVMTRNNNASEIRVTGSEGDENSDPWMENLSETTTSESGTRSGSTCTEAKLLTLFL